jgi:hypothetical protein
MSIDKETRLRLELLQAIQLGDADLVLAKMKELAEWQKNSDMAKLSRITTISEKQLSALNTTLLAELEAISKLKVSDDEKSRLQQEAWGRYNDAIKYAGGLAALSTYSQKLQDQELLIQRLASIQKVSEAQATADAIRQAALEKYLATLGKLTTAQPTTSSVSKVLSSYNGSAASAFESLTLGQKATLGGYEPFTGSSMSNVDEPYIGSTAGLGLNGTGRQIPQGVTITIVDKTSGLIEIVQDAVIQNDRYGNNLKYAGSIA